MAIKTKFSFLTLVLISLSFLSACAVLRPANANFAAPSRGEDLAVERAGNLELPPPVVLTEEQSSYSLGLHLEILEDPEGELTIEEVSSPEISSQFTPSQMEAPIFGFTKSVYWARFQLKNQNPLVNEWYLKLGFANMQFVDLYTPRPTGEGFEVKQTGTLRPVSTRDLLLPKFVFVLSLPSKSEQTYYLRFQSDASMSFPLTLWSSEAFLNEMTREIGVHVIFYGVLLGLLVFHLILFFSLRERNYVYYISLLAVILFFLASYDGYIEAYVLPGLYYLSKYYLSLSFSLMFFLLVLFNDHFLEIKTHFPQLHRIDQVLLVGWAGLFLLVPFTSYSFQVSTMIPWAILSLGMTLWGGFVSLYRGFFGSRFLIIAWLGLLVTLLLVLAVRLGWIESTWVTENAFKLGVLWLAGCWSVALAERIDLLRNEREKAYLLIQSNEARYRQLVETMNDGLGMIDENDRFTFVNHQFAQMLGYSMEEMCGHLVAEFVAETDRAHLARQLSDRRAGYSKPYEIAWQRKDGSLVFTKVSPRPLFDNEKRFTGAFAIITDISELVEATQLLDQRVKERTNELSTLLNITRHISAFDDLEKILWNVSEEIRAIFDFRELTIFVEQSDGSWRALLQRAPMLSANPPWIAFTPLEALQVKEELSQRGSILVEKGDVDEATHPGFHALVGRVRRAHQTGNLCWLGVPIIRQVEIVGVMVIATECPAPTDEQIKVILASANQLAVAIENARHYELLRETARQEERTHMARDLHDSVTQVLFSAALLAEILPEMFRRDPEQGLRKLEKLRWLTRGALAEMRTMLIELRPSAIVTTPLSELIAQLAEAFSSRSGLEFQLYVEQIPLLPAEVHDAFYRIAQEALNNIVKHAQARKVIVSLSAKRIRGNATTPARNKVKLFIQDDGVGFAIDRETSYHLGIPIMKERAAAIQAKLTLKSKPGYGTQVMLVWFSGPGENDE